jgi:hypothetical protein
MRFGRVWLVRIGIALLLTGLVLLGNHAYQNWIRELPAGVRLAALYLCAAALFETGRRVARVPALNRFGEVVVAGGLSFFYYCTFAAHQVERLRVIDSPVVAAILLMLSAVGVAGVSWLRQAKGTAILGIVLASYATMLQPVGWLSCVSNLLLAGVGCFFLTRPGWSGPGWASLLTTYASFLGWQILGASGSEKPIQALWFLPVSWLLFAVPCLLGKFSGSMTDRAKSWFTGLNNGLFFLLFSSLWLWRYQDADYWLVTAVIGVVWLGSGVWCRRRSDVAAGVFMLQGLACASLAVVLKLDGYHLALALAAESLALAVAFARYHGRSELVFSIGAGAFAALMFAAGADPAYGSIEIPLWSAALGALILAAASAALLRGSETITTAKQPLARAGSSIVFGAALLATTAGWCLRLDPPWPLPTAMLMSLGLTAASLVGDRSRRWIELAFGALILLLVAFFQIPGPAESWPFIATGIAALASLWLWQHRSQPLAASEAAEATGDPAHSPALPRWLYALAIVVCTFQTIHLLDTTRSTEALGLAGSGLALVATGLFLGCPTLVPTAALLGTAALASLSMTGQSLHGPMFVVALFQFAALALIAVPKFRALLAGVPLISSALILRLTGFIAWCLAWGFRAPEHWGDWLALSAFGLILVSNRLRIRLIPEAAGFLALALLWLMSRLILIPWQPTADPLGWQGWVTIATLGYLVATSNGRPATFAKATHLRITNTVTSLACAFISLWATQMLVWRFGWKPAAVLWTVLGFAFVSIGLWQRRQILRLAGFCLLAIALIRVFAIDVWDFNAFMRIVSFLVLGIALMLLGWFYHRFAPLLKQWFESDDPDGRP